MILEAMTGRPGHVTAEEIHASVVLQYPDMSLSTVYRTLDTLRDLGLVTQTDMGAGREEYHYATQAHHHHLVCRKCGGETELDAGVLAPLAERLLENHGFHAEVSHFAIFGTCAACAGAA